MIADILLKIGSGTPLVQAEKDELNQFVADAEQTKNLVNGIFKAGGSSITQLSQITNDLGDQIAGRFISPTTEVTEPTDSNFSGAFLSGTNQLLSDGLFWLANVSAGLVSMGFGPQGIFTRLFADAITQVSDDGTTYRKGRLGMSVLPGQTAPSWGLNYQDSATATELIVNGDFATNDLTGWTTDSGTWTGSSGYADGDDTSASLSQIGLINGGDLFSLPFKGKAESGGMGTLYIYFYASADGTGSYLSVLFKNFTDTVWVDYEINGIAPSGTQSFKVVLENFNTLHSYFDDISLTAINTANYLGFEPANGKVVSKMLDGGHAIGQIPVGAMDLLIPIATEMVTGTPGAAGNVDVGNHRMFVTFVDSYGETCWAENVSSIVTVATSAKTVALSTIPLGKWGTTSRKVYATIAGASDNPENYYLVTTINDNTTTTGTYNISDATLVTGDLIPTINTTGSRPVFPRSIFIPVQMVITSVTLAEALSGAYRSGFFLQPTAGNANQNDKYTFSFYAEAGTYTLTHIGRTANSLASPTYFVDGVSFGTLDWYTAGAVEYVTKTISNVTISTSGYHVLEVVASSNNASSVDYIVAFSELYFKPAAY